MNIVSSTFVNPLAKAHTKEIKLFFDEDSQEPVSSTLKSGNIWSEELAQVSSLFWHSESAILDVGAHCGTFSALAASFTRNKVISIEADPRNFELIVQNKEINNFTHQECHNLAASDQEGQISFCPNGPSGHVLQEGGEEPSITVPAKPLDSVLNGQRVDFIKLDVEGWELNVINGLSKTINKYNPPIVFEVNGFTLQWFDKTPNDLLRLLEEKFGYQIFALSTALVPINCYEPFPFGVTECLALQPMHIQTIAKYLTLPLSFRARKEIYTQSKKYGNSDMQGYFNWYQDRMPQ